MPFQWPFRDRRRKILEAPFPEEWLPVLLGGVRQYGLLTSAEQTRLRDDLRIFQAEKYWEGARGFTVTDEVKVTISAFACLMTVGFPKRDYYPNVQTIVVYPGAYVAESERPSGDSQVIDIAAEPRLGEAHGFGPVILSWSDVVEGARKEADGRNLVIHEFAHKLDFRDGDANGVPLLRDGNELERWAAIMSAEYELLVEDVARQRHTPLQPYGATNPAEFFAVCTECFFEKPRRLRKHKPELYAVLRDYYGIDWARRFTEP
ncbi:MAG: zinc-dependent peptidase [Capsulimonadaceae bacterium]|nr:zinc-dependent peptidase [Capsulimonadaceae bacterium]